MAEQRVPIRASLRRGCIAAHARRLFALFLLVAVTIPARAQSTSEILAALDNDDYTVRERITADLLADETLTAERIDALVIDTWSPEQRHRLFDIARHHFIRDIVRREYGRGAQGSLGVTISAGEVGDVEGVDQPGVFVTRTHPGFPAYTRLKAGDLILAVNGKAPGAELVGMQLTGYLIEQIKGYAAGERVAMTIYRDGARREVDIQLASRAALDAIYERNRSIQAQAVVIVNGQMQIEQNAAFEALASQYGPPQLHPEIEARWLKRRAELDRLINAR